MTNAVTVNCIDMDLKSIIPTGISNFIYNNHPLYIYNKLSYTHMAYVCMQPNTKWHVLNMLTIPRNWYRANQLLKSHLL